MRIVCTLFMLMIYSIAYAVGNSDIKSNNTAGIRLPPSQAIYNGHPVIQAPTWIVAMYVSESKEAIIDCTGNALTKNYILTAAHCVTNASGPTYWAYVGTNTSLSSPIKVKADSYVQYESLDIAIVKLTKDLPISTAQHSFYHSYTVYLYKDLHTNLARVMGYGMSSTNRSKYLHYLDVSLVTSLKVPERSTIWFSSLNNSPFTTTKGDSGGPVILNGKFGSVPYTKLIGVLSGYDDIGPSVIKLSPDIMKWIATTTKIALFSDPIDNEDTMLKSDNTVDFQGYGKFPSQGKIEVTESVYHNVVANCTKPDQISSDKWKCQAELGNDYDPEATEYEATIKNAKGEDLDFVNFNINTSGYDLLITHPSAGFIYHTPVNSTYLITGLGFPGSLLNYKLISDNDKQTNLDPCVNPEANAAIPANGIWRCRIKSTSDMAGAYTFYVDYQGADINDQEIHITTRKYSIEPNKNALNIKVLEPQNNSEVELNYNIKLKFTPTNDSLTKIHTYDIYEDKPYIFTSIFSSANKAQESTLSISSSVSGYSNLKAFMYIDNDEEPIATDSIRYFIKLPRFQLTSITESSKFRVGESAPIAGFTSPYDSGNEVVYRISFNDQPYPIGVATIKANGEWSSPPFIFAYPGDYAITAALVRKDTQAPLTESNITTVVAPEPVIISNPCCCDRCTIS